MVPVMRRASALVTALGLAAVTIAVIALRPRDPAFKRPRDVPDLARRVDRAVREGMREGRVPQVAVAIVHRGRVAWTQGYGGAGTDTPFQVGSISKPVAALGLLRLADRRGVRPDAPIALRGWRAPPGLTLQRLLSHTAGLSVDGYQGLDPARPLASTLEELHGAGEARPVQAVDAPGAGVRYSGGGYTVAQLWGEQTAGQRFAALMDDTVLEPLRMRGSGFEQDAPPRGALVAHDARGDEVPSYRYAALAAAGLWSTVSDVGRFVAFAASADPLARSMRRPAPATGGAWGMGLELRALEGGGSLIEHEGINRGWHARFVAEPRSGWGLVVLTSSDGGGEVVDAVMAELAG